jgi:hypothetical protein
MLTLSRELSAAGGHNFLFVILTNVCHPKWNEGTATNLCHPERSEGPVFRSHPVAMRATFFGRIITRSDREIDAKS